MTDTELDALVESLSDEVLADVVAEDEPLGDPRFRLVWFRSRALRKRLVREVQHLRTLNAALKAERNQARDLLCRCWDAVGLLDASVTGQPEQAWDEPSDLLARIEAMADSENSLEEDRGRLEAENTRLREAMQGISHLLRDPEPDMTGLGRALIAVGVIERVLGGSL